MNRMAIISALAAWLLIGAGCVSGPAAGEPSGTEPRPVTAGEASISVTENGFSPATITISKGTPVSFKNAGSRPHWPASAVHPTHLVLPDFDALRGLEPGESYTYTFTKVGTWRYHDHLNPSLSGAVTVVEQADVSNSE